MKADLHPEYHPVIFQDMSTGKQYITRSTAKSDRVEQVDGVDHFVISIGVTADSHPFFTGQKQFVDTEGRIDKFQKRFGDNFQYDVEADLAEHLALLASDFNLNDHVTPIVWALRWCRRHALVVVPRRW